MSNDNLPSSITSTALWKRLDAQPPYQEAIVKIRAVASALAQTVGSSLPEFTDHSVKHMDALWRVTEQVLTPDEITGLKAGEALLLATSFYVHDLGMAATATTPGKEEIQSTEHFKAAYRRFKKVQTEEAKARELALHEAVREMHAKAALRLATESILGLDRFLIEDSAFRAAWGHMIGQVAESHHWDLDEVERSLGARKAIPGPDGEDLDLGYVACILRIVDFAHINRDRAYSLDRLLRKEVPPASTVHWDARALITGPSREGDRLIFGSTEPLQNSDAWWLFYDLATQLDIEIRGVYEYLRDRTASSGRFSLTGVKGVETPTIFSRYVQLPAGVVPIDIRVQPDSMERVVELLGGPNLYGRDALAPLRELIQNSRDAVMLRAAAQRAKNRPQTPGLITISLETAGECSALTVSDNGVGMTRAVIQRHLLSVGSDFWNSLDFYRDFSGALDAGFSPIGKFGIGFLSVFMMGSHIEVETEAAGNNRLRLTLQGVGRRGELREGPSTGNVGTAVRVSLKSEYAQMLTRLGDLVRARAPMLPIPITVEIKRDGDTTTEQIAPGWWKIASDRELISFSQDWPDVAYSGKSLSPEEFGKRAAHRYAIPWDSLDPLYYRRAYFGGKWDVQGWPGSKPQFQDETERLISMGGEPSFGVVRCSQGIAVDWTDVPDITGIAEAGTLDLTVSRDRPVGPAKAGFRQYRDEHWKKKLIADLKPSVITRIDELQLHGMLPARTNFLRAIASIFGEDILDKISLAWIPVTEPPGNLVHRSRTGLAQLLAVHGRVLVAVGVSAGGAYGAATRHIPIEDLAKMVLITIRNDALDVSYERRHELEREHPGGTLVGPLPELLQMSGQNEGALVLTRFLLRVIANAWSTTPETLRAQEWRLDYKDDAIWCDLRKPARHDRSEMVAVLKK